MKIKLHFKTPDVVDYALEDIDEDLREEVKNELRTWVEYGECVSIEIDTVAGTAVVLPA